MILVSNLYSSRKITHLIYLHCDPLADTHYDMSRPKAFFLLPLWILAIKLASHVVVVSNYLSRLLLVRYNRSSLLAHNYVSIVPLNTFSPSVSSLGIEGSFVQDWICKAKEKNFTILTTHCYLKKGKNLSQLLRFISSSPNLALLVIGDGPELSSLLQQVQSDDLACRVLLPGHFANPHSYIQACDLYVSMSYSEGFGLSNLEAYLLGMPILVPDNPLNRELYPPLDGIYLFNPSSRDSIATLMNTYSLDNFRLRWLQILNSLVHTP
jgi:glycosyltransferase involved in cell wall biosynthesis